MRALFLFPCLILCCGVSLARTLTLEAALKKNLVSASLSAKGGFSGKCLLLRLSNHTKDSLLIKLEPGHRFKAPDKEKQDLLVVKETMLRLGPLAAVSADLKVYCCQAGNRAPQVADKYGAGSMADSNLVKLAGFLNQNEFDEQAEQQAVWALSDNQPAAAISGGIDSLVLPLRQFVAALKGETLPWYCIQSRTIVYKSGYIRVIPTRLNGDLIYSLNRSSYVTLLVTDENGFPAAVIRSQWLQPSSAATYRVELPIIGLEKGKYRVELRTEENVLVASGFEL